MRIQLHSQHLSQLLLKARMYASNSHATQKVQTLQNGDKELEKRILAAASQSMKLGNVIAVPTDTIYGIACLAQCSEAVDKMYEIKHRDRMKPIAISIADVVDIDRWCEVTVPRNLLNSLLPGPVTVVFQRSELLNPKLNPHTHLIGVRIPDNGFIRDLVRYSNHPLALTSANHSNTPSSLNISEFKDLWPQLDLVIDGGQINTSISSRQGSTVVDLSQSGKYRIIRNGSAYEETIAKLQKWNLTEV